MVNIQNFRKIVLKIIGGSFSELLWVLLSALLMDLNFGFQSGSHVLCEDVEVYETSNTDRKVTILTHCDFTEAFDKSKN